MHTPPYQEVSQKFQEALRSWTETGNKAETSGNRKDLHPLEYYWLVRRTTICKFILQVCQAILAEFKHEYLCCPNSPQDWKRVEEKLRTRWNVSNAVGAIDGKHSAMKKPKKSGSDYYYKDFFSLVLIALI